MPPSQFGTTFQPDDSQLPPWMRRGQGTPVQQAMQILSLRLPHVFGAQAPISAGLAAGGMRGAPAGPTFSTPTGGSNPMAPSIMPPVAPPSSSPSPPMMAAYQPNVAQQPQQPRYAPPRVDMGVTAPSNSYPTQVQPAPAPPQPTYAPAPATPPSFALPGGGTDQQAQTNWYATHQGQPAPGGGTYNNTVGYSGSPYGGRPY